jgi:hypothetical protein
VSEVSPNAPMPDPTNRRRNALFASSAGFFTGVLGNLLADWVQHEWLNPFAPWHLYVIVVLTAAGLLAGTYGVPVFLALPIRAPYRQPVSIVVVVFLLMFAIVVAYQLPRARPCSELRLSYLTLFTGDAKDYRGDEPIPLVSGDVARRSNQSGRANFSNSRTTAGCTCEWWARVNRRPRERLSMTPASVCGFSIPFDDTVHDIELLLNVGADDPDVGFQIENTFNFLISDGVVRR